ncbi:MAG: cation:proton antiporter [Candidatus Bathyarchaeia archaeon]|nr:cation:proton antiporter [Candidatus Bathyarchaeota archaeon]
MLDPIILALILAGAIIVIGFLGNYIFERLGVPDLIILILLGVMIGPLSGIIDVASIMDLAPYLSALAMVYILFDGGLAMNIYRVFAESPRAAVLAFLGYGLNVTFTTMLIHYFLIPNVPMPYALLFGTILGGSCSVAAVSLASKIKVSEKCSTILRLESAITDILCIVFSVVVIEIILTGNVDITTISQRVASRFSTGIVLGLILGLTWLGVFKRIAKSSYVYMLTLAVVLLSYAVSEVLGGSGSLCALVFGIVLGNEREIYRMFRIEHPRELMVDEGLKRFESEIAFLLRTFFFVYIGLILRITELNVILISIFLSIILLLTRFAAVRIATIRSADLIKERPIMGILISRGLAAAVLATLPMQYAGHDLFFAELYPLYINLTVFVILETALITSIGVPILKRRTNIPINTLKI